MFSFKQKITDLKLFSLEVFEARTQKNKKDSFPEVKVTKIMNFLKGNAESSFQWKKQFSKRNGTRQKLFLCKTKEKLRSWRRNICPN